MKGINKTILGYDSISDFFTSVFGLLNFKYTSIISCVAMFTSFIEGYIYNDAKAIYFMLFLLLVDFLTGTAKAIKNKTFTSTRFPRVFVTAIVYTLLLCVSWQAAKYSILFIWLPSGVYGGLIGTMLISFYENLTALGFIPDNYLNDVIDKLKKNKKVE